MLEALLNDGFAYHDSQSGRFAGELEAAADEARASPALIERFVRLGVHTIGEHLGDWPRAARLADRALAGAAADGATARAWAHLSIARLLAGEAVAAQQAELTFLAGAGGDFRAPLVEMRFLLASALVGGGRPGEAAGVYEGALRLARGLGEAAPARAIAVASNNLASDLLERAARTPAETALMAAAADAAHEFWLKCGDWRNEERALYLKAMVANALGEPALALQHADRALAIIAAAGGGAEPVDETFLDLTRAHALKLAGQAKASSDALAKADAAAAAFAAEGLKSWYAAERTRVIGAAPRAGRLTAGREVGNTGGKA